MSGETWLVLAGIALMVGLVAWFVGRPFLGRGAELPEAADPRAVALLAEREAVLLTLRDLDADHAAGRLAEDDWRSLRAEAVDRAARLLAALDALAAESEGSTARLAAELEAEVQAAGVRGDAGPVCPGCGHRVAPGDRFCAGCGRALTDVAAALG
jgi:hypothetical protein